MATLFNTKISQTYEGLLKTINNAALSATLRELTDGSGNQSGLFLNTAGDFKVTSVLEWGSLKDTGTGVTITQFVTAANGIENFNNDTTLPTSAAVKLYVDTKFSQTDTLTEVLGFGNTTSGKDIAVSANDDITFTDTSKAIFGTGADLQIYHDGNNSYIAESGTGLLNIFSNGTGINLLKNTGEFMAEFATDGAVSLFYDNSKKFETTTDGSKVTGNLLVTGTITGAGGSFLPLAGGTMTGNIVLNDNVKSIYGTLGDGLEIFHDGTDSYIDDTGTGSLVIRSSDNIKLVSNTGDLYFQGIKDASVKLYFNNAEKLITTTSGVSVTGNLVTTANVNVGANATFVDGGKALFGDSNDLTIFHDASDSFIQNTGGDLKVSSTNIRFLKTGLGEFMANFFADGANEFFYDGTKRIETLNDGAKVTGNLEVTGTITGAGGSFLPLIGGTMTGDIVLNDGVKTVYGTANDGLWIYHDGNNSYINDVGTGDLYILGSDDLILGTTTGEVFIQCNENSSVELKFNNATKFETTNTGIAVTGDIVPTGDINIADFKFLTLGNSQDFTLLHNGSGSVIKNFTGALNIEQAAVTESIVVKVSNANALDTTALTINREGDLITGADVTIAGNLTVNGTTTTVNSQTLSVADPLISLATANTANSLDIGFYGKYNDGTARYLGLFNDASDSNKFRLFRGTTVEPTTTVNIGGTGYVAADLVVAGLEATTGVFSTSVTVAAASPLFRLTDTDNNTNIDLLSIGGAFILNSTSDQIYQIGGTEKFRIASSTSTFAGNVALTGGSLSITSDGSNAATLTESSVGIFTIAALDDIILDAAGDIALDAGGDDIRFRVNGTTYGSFNNASSNLNIYSSIQDKDIVFVGNDGGTAITALSLDMSNGGSATFRDDIDFGGKITQTGTGTNTFAGNVEFGGRIRVASGTDQGSQLCLFADGNGATSLAGFTFSINTGGNNSRTQAVLIDQSKNATFAGNVTTGQSLTVNGVGNNSSLTLGANTGNWVFTNVQASRNLEISDSDGTGVALTIDTNANATFAGKILAGAGATAAATINAFSTTVASNLFSALRVIDNTSASSFWDIGATGGSSTELRFCHNGTTTPKIKFTHLGGATFTGSVGISNTNPLFELCIGSTNAPNRNGIEIAIATQDTGTNILQNYNRTTNAYTPLRIAANEFSVNTGSSATEKMRITQLGNLLINHTAGVSETKLYVEGSAMPLTGDAASVEDMLTLYRYGSATVWSGGASLAVGRYSTGGSSAPKSRLDFKLKDAAGTNVAAPETTVMTMQSNGYVGIGTITPQKPFHLEGVTGSQMLVTGASDTVGDTAGILFRAESGEGNSDLRAKGGIFFEREAANGIGSLILAVNTANNNDSATKTDKVITLTKDRHLEVNKVTNISAPTIFGENYTVTPGASATTEINCFTGIIPEQGIYEIYVKGNPNAQGSGAYASTFAGLISIACDFVSSDVQFRISQTTLIQDGGGSANRQLVVAASLYNSANNSNLLLQPVSAKATTMILINVSQYINSAGSNQDIRIIRKL